MDPIERSTIREWITLTITPVQHDILDVKSAIDKLAIQQASVQQIDQLRYQVASLSEMVNELEARMRHLERYVYLLLFMVLSLILVSVTALVVSSLRPI